ncbi:hypothetical protein V6Z12_D10G161900 [Gossypium hirsutum]
MFGSLNPSFNEIPFIPHSIFSRNSHSPPEPKNNNTKPLPNKEKNITSHSCPSPLSLSKHLKPPHLHPCLLIPVRLFSSHNRVFDFEL